MVVMLLILSGTIEPLTLILKMPLKEWSSQKVVNSNIKELMTWDMSEKRKKAIQTYADKKWISFEKAKQIMSVAISLSNKKK